MSSLKKHQSIIEFLPHLVLTIGIVLVSVYIGYLIALQPVAETAQIDPYLINEQANYNNQVNYYDPIDNNNQEVTQDLPSDIVQTNQQPFDTTLEISDTSFAPLTVQLTNQQLLRVLNTASTPQVISFSNDTLMIYPSSEYVFALDKLGSGQHIIWADSAEGNTQQASITII